MQDALPDVKSFSVTNLKYMKYFYDLYNNSNRLQLVDDSKHEYVYKQEKANPLQILKSCLLILAVISPEKSQKTHIILIFLLSEKDMVKKN